MTLATDLHWLIREGYVVEFNDGSLDLPRAKAPAAIPTEEKPAVAEEPPVVTDPERSEVASEKSEATNQLEPVAAETEPAN